MAELAVWQKSSFSGGGDSSDCVELTVAGGAVLLRESDTPADVIAATPTTLAALILGLRSGQLGHH